MVDALKDSDQTIMWQGGCYLSTDDKAFNGAAGNQIKAIFTDKCEYEE